MTYADEPNRYDSTFNWSTFRLSPTTATPTVPAGTIFWTGTELAINVGTLATPNYILLASSHLYPS